MLEAEVNKELQDWVDSLTEDRCSIREWEAYQKGLSGASKALKENAILKKAVSEVLASEHTNKFTKDLLKFSLKEIEDNEEKRGDKVSSGKTI